MPAAYVRCLIKYAEHRHGETAAGLGCGQFLGGLNGRRGEGGYQGAGGAFAFFGEAVERVRAAYGV